MILVYISILVMVAAFIWFVIQVGRTLLKFKKIIVSMAKKAEKVREGLAKTKEYQEATEKTVNEIRGSMQKKAGQVRFVTEQGKDLVDVAQETRGKMGEVLRFFPKKLF